MARQGVTEARSLLRTVLVNRLVFTPVPRPAHLPPPKGPGRKPRFVYELRGEGSLSKLFTELISASSVVAPYLKALPPSMGRSGLFDIERLLPTVPLCPYTAWSRGGRSLTPCLFDL